jgi:D-alanyl-D-alanine dipeptidase
VFRKEVLSCGFKLVAEPVLPALHENYIMVFAPVATNMHEVGAGWGVLRKQQGKCSHLPAGFTYLDQVDSSIQVSLRYQMSENFMGTPIDGYICTQPQGSNRVVLTEQAARALKAVQEDVRKDGYSLLVYDAFRPQRAVDHFARWSADVANVNSVRKAQYYPNIDKSELFAKGYIAHRSGHSRGSTVDLTLIAVDKQVTNPQYSVREFAVDPSKNSIIGSHDYRVQANVIHWPFLEDSSVDMGTSFDLMDVASHGDYPHLPAKCIQMRQYLDAKMVAHGFQGYDQEWWHFTLLNEPFPDTYHDFPVV